MKWVVSSVLIAILGGPVMCQAADMQKSRPIRSFEPTELEARKDIKDLVQQAIDHSDFALLEKLSASYREGKLRMPSGGSKLGWFYANYLNTIERQKFEAQEQFLDQWEKSYPNSPAVHILRSYLFYDRAFFYRGGDTSDKVALSAWKPFFNYIRLATENQEKYKSIANIDPQWYVVMMDIAQAGQWGKSRFDALVKEASERYPYYYKIYLSAFGYLLPKWNGSYSEMEHFARNAEKWTPEDGHGIYARLYIDADRKDVIHLFHDTEVSWPEMKQGLEDILAKYPTEWNLHNYAKFACLAGDKDTTRRLMDQIWTQLFDYPAKVHSMPDLTTLQAVWEEDRFHLFNRCKKWVDDPATTTANAPSEDGY